MRPYCSNARQACVLGPATRVGSAVLDQHGGHEPMMHGGIVPSLA
jgi:hypothetical protein